MTADQKNQIEDIIEQLMIQDETQQIKDIINNAPKEKQRSLIALILEENTPDNRKVFSKIEGNHKKIKESRLSNNNSNKYTLDSYATDNMNLVREYVKVAPTEVKQFGEVMTPIWLVDSMLDQLPYEVWTNPNLKWLDPCSGIGTFMSVVVTRLMKGLESFQPNPELRYKHIMENMIYVCELQSKNCFLYMYAFDPEDNFAINIHNGSFLDYNFNNVMSQWGVDKFDVIVMNPPYNDGNENRGSSHVLWDKFVIKTLNVLKQEGFMCAVHPDGWRSFDGGFKNIQLLLRKKQIRYLELHNKYDGIKTFGASTTYDFYCLQNVPNIMLTTIKTQDGKIERVDLSKMEFIPNGMFKEFELLLAKEGEEKVNLLYNCSYHHQLEHMNKTQTEEFIYPVVYTIPKNGIPNLIYSSTNQKGHYNIPKVIWSNGISHPIVDLNGEFALSQFSYAIIDEPKNLPYIQRAMLNPDFIKLMGFSDGVTGTGHRYNRKVISLFKKDFWKEFLY